MPLDSARQSIADFHASIADPDVFCGGGSVAAITAAGAAATALLVMQLDVNRRANQEHRTAIETSIGRAGAMVTILHALADADIASLAVLLDAQRALKSGEGTRQQYLEALTEAARSPL